MSIRTKVMAAAMAAGVVPLVTATPAGAVDGEDSVTQSMAVNSLTCRFGGTSSYDYAPYTDVTTIAALAGVYDDPGCRDALYQVEVVVAYESPAGSGRILTARARGVNALEDPEHEADWGVQTSIEVPGPTGPIEVRHVASFICTSDGRPYTCTGTATTNPK